MSPRRRLSLALVWLALLLVGGWWISQQLQLTGDLRKFMPEARTPAQKLLIDELGEGPGSRLLLLAISGDRPEVLARQSAAMVAALAGDRFADGPAARPHDSHRWEYAGGAGNATTGRTWSIFKCKGSKAYGSCDALMRRHN